VFAAPVASDRMSMYLIPFQIGVFSRLPQLLRTQISRQGATAAVLVLYAMALGIWLAYSPAANSDYIPYRNILWP
jgi:uncharacterized protein with PQ loop repeat